MAMTRKQKMIESLESMLKDYRVLDNRIHIDPHVYGIWERTVRDELINLEKCDMTTTQLAIVWRLVDAVLSEALNRDPNIPAVVGRKRVSGDVGKIK
jgi:hypothetical protein